MAPPTPSQDRPLPAGLLRDTRWTLILLGATMLAWVFGVPIVLIALLTGPAAAGFAIAGLVRSRGLPGAAAIRVWLWIAIGVGALSTATAGGVLVLREPLTQLNDCYSRAITETAKQQCVADYDKAYNDLLARYGLVTKP